MKPTETNYQEYKDLCLKLKVFQEMKNTSPIILHAIRTCEQSKSILDRLNPEYKIRFLNDNQ